jgi:hypothetical protein
MRHAVAAVPHIMIYAAPHDYEVGEDCDGTLTFTPEKGPVIMFGPSCDPPRTSRRTARTAADVAGAPLGRQQRRDHQHQHASARLGDAARIGFATAANASDPELIECVSVASRRQ